MDAIIRWGSTFRRVDLMKTLRRFTLTLPLTVILGVVITAVPALAGRTLDGIGVALGLVVLGVGDTS